MIYYLGLFGVAVFAISGGLAAGEKKLDWVGVVALGVITSLGGGTIRDLLLQREQIFWIANTVYLWVALIASVFTIVCFRFIASPVRSLLIADAIGLAMFSILGAQVAELEGATPLVVLVMGVLTGVAGGAMRDVLTSEIPMVFRGTETLYSVASLGGVLTYLIAQQLGFHRDAAALSGVGVAVALRFAAIRWDIRLPVFHVPGRAE